MGKRTTPNRDIPTAPPAPVSKEVVANPAADPSPVKQSSSVIDERSLLAKAPKGWVESLKKPLVDPVPPKRKTKPSTSKKETSAAADDDEDSDEEVAAAAVEPTATETSQDEDIEQDLSVPPAVVAAASENPEELPILKYDDSLEGWTDLPSAEENTGAFPISTSFSTRSGRTSTALQKLPPQDKNRGTVPSLRPRRTPAGGSQAFSTPATPDQQARAAAALDAANARRIQRGLPPKAIPSDKPKPRRPSPLPSEGFSGVRRQRF